MIIEAVGLAHKPGRNTIRRDAARLFMRAFLWLLHRRTVPMTIRTPALEVVFFLGRVIGQKHFGIQGASKGNTFENDLMKLIFNATAIANIADNAASAPLTNLYVGLHTGDPGETGDQTTSEISYTGYARIAVARTSGGWTITNNSGSPVANIDFGEMTGGAGGTVTHCIVGTASSGAGKLLYKGTVTPNIVVTSGVIPRLTTASAITED